MLMLVYERSSTNFNFFYKDIKSLTKEGVDGIKYYAF